MRRVGTRRLTYVGFGTFYGVGAFPRRDGAHWLWVEGFLVHQHYRSLFRLEAYLTDAERKCAIAPAARASIAALTLALGAAPAAAQDVGAASAPPQPDRPLPPVERVISDEEFAEAVPQLDPADDTGLLAPLESIEAFERRLAGEAQQADAAAPLGDPALADGDPVEAIGDAPVRDAALAEPLPPLETFETAPVTFAQEASDEEIVEVAYRVTIEGLEAADAETPTDLADLFGDLSALEDGDGEAANVAQIAARLTEDSALMRRILASEGWFEAQANTRIDRSGEANGQPLTAVISVVPGARYVFSDITINAAPTVPTSLIADNVALKIGDPIIADRVQGAEAQVALALPENGYPFASVGQRDILLDPETGEGAYTLPVTVGPRSRFGTIRVVGDPVFDADHVAVLARFERGELYDSRLIDDLRQALVATGLFATVSVQPEASGEAAGEGDGTEYATIVVDQGAGPPRTLAAGAGYATGEGLRLDASWTHRNLFPPEGALIANIIAGTQQQGAGVTFRRANAGRRDRTVTATLEALRNDFAAFEAFTGRLSGLVSYDSTALWQKPLTYAYGAQLIGTNEQDFNFATQALDRRTFFIGGLIGQIGIDRTDSLLDATEGFRVTALIEPEGSLQGGFTPYVRATLDGAAFFSPSDSITLAGRVRVGTIQGIDRFDLAPSRRFYAGGGGSVRGFGFQRLGPTVEFANPDFDPTDPEDEDDPTLIRPLGGLALNEAAVEVRYRFGNFGVVAFADAGQVYEGTVPRFDDMRLGVGLGARYYTNFGPLRLDVGMPINRRPGEADFAVYVSIGQAF